MIVKTDLKNSLQSLVVYLRVEILFALLFSTVVYYLYEHKDLFFLASMNFVPVSFFGTILSVFLAFRNNNSYSRWWEARRLWGDLVNSSRFFKSQITSLLLPSSLGVESQHDDIIRASRRTLLHRYIAYINLLRMQLRGHISWKEVTPFLDGEEKEKLQATVNPASQLIVMQANHLEELSSRGHLTDYRLISLQKTLERFYNMQGGCERIKHTPFPREYDSFIRTLIWILMGILPFYFLNLFVGDTSKALIIPLTVFVTMIIGFANKAGEILEDPFENQIHDVPMSALCNTIEKDLLEYEPSAYSPQDKSHKEPVIW